MMSFYLIVYVSLKRKGHPRASPDTKCFPDGILFEKLRFVRGIDLSALNTENVKLQTQSTYG